MDSFVGRITVDTDALRHNAATFRGMTQAKICAVVKANGYGHGLVPASRAFVAAGVDYLGVAQLEEARELRQHIPGVPILTWIFDPSANLEEAVQSGLDISVGAPWALDRLLTAAQHCASPARLHIEVDTGMSRGGFAPEMLLEVAHRIAKAERDGIVDVIGLWSHLARADEPDSGETERQLDRFETATRALRDVGVHPRLRHLANTAGTLWHPRTHLDMVRPGIGLYGISPEPAVATAQDLGLQPAMTLSSRIIAVREVPAGTGISYGHTETAADALALGTVPLGYADGIPRAASSRGPVMVNGHRSRIMGRVCMDQVVIALPKGATIGDEVVFFGSEGPTVDEWADAAGTIGYEITTRLGRHVPRHYRGTVGL
ncbi:alanine racemase [Flaviflexus equikiangi]|uniref:alanine racemase n=1 Tax=Flaviflexus equikiangi TaxID=2758573 RepID=UPI0015F61D66|nr:alanine racemase [Flaviflexus equikiangi]